MSGMETGIVNLVAPGDVVIVGYAGFFGRRIAQMAARHGADVVEVTRDWGEIVPNEALLEALDRRPEARLLAVVHAETSTGAQHPLAELGAALRDRDTLLFADCVTSLGGIPLAFSEWGVDFAYSCTQKALGAPPGMSPIACSERALEQRPGARPRRCRSRSTSSSCSTTGSSARSRTTTPRRSCTSTRSTRRCATRSRRASRPAGPATSRRGGTCRRRSASADSTCSRTPSTSCRTSRPSACPTASTASGCSSVCSTSTSIEVGGGLGPDAPAMWRIGLMGPNASIEVADRVLAAFDTVLESEPAHAG